MPFINGKRVTLEEWRAAHPDPPLFGYADGTYDTRFLRVAGEEDWVSPEVEPGHRVAARQSDARLHAIAETLGVRLDDPVMADIELGGVTELKPYWITPVEHEPVERPDAGRTLPDPRFRAVAPRSGPEGHLDAREVAATRFSRAKGLPKHRKIRHSQTPEGRRERYIRQKADRLGVAYAVAERMTYRQQPRNPGKDPS